MPLKSNFATQLEQYFILDTPFTLTKSIEEDYPAPSNDFLVPPKWDLYAELFVEQAAEAHNWNFHQRKMVAITDARLVKAQNAIIRASGPLIGTVGTKVAAERNCSYQAIWICMGYAFWFLSRVRRQLLLEAVLGTRDRKKIDRYLSDANKMSLFWPDNSDLLGKKFFDHIVVSERRQEELRDVLMKDARRSSDQLRPRNHILYRQPSGSSGDPKDDPTFVSRQQHYRSASFDGKGTFRFTEVRSAAEERSFKHSEASSLVIRKSSRQTEDLKQSKRRRSKDDENNDRREKRYSSSKHADEPAPSVNDRITAEKSKVRNNSGKENISKQTADSSHSARRNSRRNRSSSPSRSYKVRTSVDDRCSKNYPALRKRRSSEEAAGSNKKGKSLSNKTSATVRTVSSDVKVSCRNMKTKRSSEDSNDKCRETNITERYDVTTVKTATDTKISAPEVTLSTSKSDSYTNHSNTEGSSCLASPTVASPETYPDYKDQLAEAPVSCQEPPALDEVFSQVCISIKNGHVRCSEASMGSGSPILKEVEVTSQAEKRDVRTRAQERDLDYAETRDSSRERGDGCCADLEKESLVKDAANSCCPDDEKSFGAEIPPSLRSSNSLSSENGKSTNSNTCNMKEISQVSGTVGEPSRHSDKSFRETGCKSELPSKILIKGSLSELIARLNEHGDNLSYLGEQASGLSVHEDEEEGEEEKKKRRRRRRGKKKGKKKKGKK
ncbi:hypothetical protein ACHWQZ_G015581 [Mnemiopsis leidyi]